MDDKMKCEKCNEDYSEEFEFCPYCGSYPPKYCPNVFPL